MTGTHRASNSSDVSYCIAMNDQTSPQDEIAVIAGRSGITFFSRPGFAPFDPELFIFPRAWHGPYFRNLSTETWFPNASRQTCVTHRSRWPSRSRGKVGTHVSMGR
jgi:hypothetical protein